KTNHIIDSKTKRNSDFSEDISAYDLILKNKERLLSFEEPTRFIFSHSALREGWDNPNVFQICTLKHSESKTTKRQEVGRGLRLCVNKDGHRMDAETCGSDVHDINKLTVIASESYKDFVGDLQKEIKNVLYERPEKATKDYFEGKTIMMGDQRMVIDHHQASLIYKYLVKNDYIDDDDQIIDTYRTDLKNNTLKALPENLKPLGVGVHQLIQGIFDESIFKDMFEDGNKTRIQENELNDNFYKKEFQTLWGYINHKYAYTVNFDSEELIENSIGHINDKLFVSELQYTTSTGEQKDDLNVYVLERGESFTAGKTKTQSLKYAQTSQIKYDLIGKIATGTVLTRRTVAAILQSLKPQIFAMFKNNPEEFIAKVIKLIKEQKATMIVEHISYDQIEGKYDSAIFTAEKHSQNIDKAFRAQKHIQDYVYTDGMAVKSVEHRFAQDLDSAEEVCVYAKLPKGFAIPTPVGNYSPDWAIAFNAGEVKHIFFIAETKGTMDSLQLRPIEQAKISCAKKLFNEVSTSEVKYYDVDSYQSLLDIMGKL
ncbi:MAG: restriction endonuclease subunit R, partial [Eubacteriales bacterium]